MNPQSSLMQKSWLTVLFLFIKSLLRAGIDASNVISEGVAMADAMVIAARDRQVIDLGISMENYEQDALDQAAIARLKTGVAIAEYIGGNAEREAFFKSERQKLAEVVQKRKLAVQAERATD